MWNKLFVWNKLFDAQRERLIQLGVQPHPKPKKAAAKGPTAFERGVEALASTQG